MSRSFLGAVVGTALVVCRLAAQSPEQRDSLERLRSGLSALADSGAVLRREAAGIARAKLDRDNAALHLELGFIAYRLGEITGKKKHYDDAASEFEWASELQPDWPYPWYGLGLSELAMGEFGIVALENVRQALGRDNLSKAAQAFFRATSADPSFWRAVVDLAETAMRQRIRAKIDEALTALRAAATTPAGRERAFQIARGRLERQAGEGDTALVAFQQYVAMGGDSGIGLLEEARTLYFLRRPADAESRYFEGVQRPLSAEARTLYRTDISWIASPEELLAFDALAADGLAPWLGTFWRRRDGQDARAPGERLAEHHRRYFYALRNFRLVSRHRHYDVTERYRSDQREFDDRGVIYLRHGEPDNRATYARMGIEPNESWQYRRPEGNRIFHFVARDDVQDFKLVESLADVFGLDSVITFQSRQMGSPDLAALFESRAPLDPEYGRRGRTSALVEERRSGRVSLREGTTTDSHVLRFASPIAPVVQSFVLGDSATGGGRLLLVFAVPAHGLLPETVDDAVAYPIGVRVSGVSTGDERSLYVDTTRVFVAPRPLSGEQYMSWYMETPIAPGDYRLRVAVLQPGKSVGAVLPADSVNVPAFGATPFALSGLVAGRRGSGIERVVGTDTIRLNPLPNYPAGSDLELYYEVHGLTRGQQFHTRVEVRKEGRRSVFGAIGSLFGGGRAPIALEYNGVASGVFSKVFQTVPLSSLGVGRYQLTLTLTQPGSDIRHTRETHFMVVPKRP